MRRLASLLLLLAACGGGGGGAPGTRIVAVTPAPDSDAGEPPTEIRVRFDRPVNQDSFNENTFLLTWSGGDGVFGNANDVTLFTSTLSFPNSTTAVLDLSAIPLPDEIFRLRLVGTGARKILAADTLALDGEFTGAFPSGDGTEGGDFVMFFRGTTTVEAMTPEPGTSVAAPGNVAVTLSADVDAATVVPASFRILRAGGDGNFTSGNEVALVPAAITRSGTLFRFDLAGNALPADAYQVVLAAAGAGTALRFDGVDDLVRVAPAIQFAPGTGSLTVECWVDIEDPARADGLFECADGDFSNGWRLRQVANGAFLFEVSGATATRTASGGPVPSGWHHVAGVLDGAAGEVRLYVDGALAAFDATGGPGAVTPTAPLLLGKAGATFLKGSLDEVRVWSVARTGADIDRDRYRRLNGNEAQLRAYWRMDDNILQLVVDATSAQHTGTLGVDQNPADDDPVSSVSTAWPVVKDLGGSPLDGTFQGTLPAGIGKPGVDFIATFQIP
ncbi:MAG TPA: LamG domain-containing protein [Planctomycetota bacterium]|nr:LamG domain-containing protein [Planctomycetota bacterium]